MRYENKELGFSFDLPDGWNKDDHNLTLTFYGPKGGLGITTELIQIQIGGILPQYFSPKSRQRFLAEPGAQVLHTRVGNEENVVVLKRARDSEISVVRDGVHYTIAHVHDAATESAIERLKQTARFPSPEQAQSALRSWADPASQAVARILRGKVPSASTFAQTRAEARGGFLERVFRRFRSEPPVQKCETCFHQMQVLRLHRRQGGVTLSREEMATGVAQAEQCWECGRVYCAECYPSRPRNTCVCGRGRDAVRRLGGTVYRGSLRLVKVRYVS